ncbi:hypothetical protein [Curtobacterium sp. UCD-KPL2560]|uniref:hypothetical protein n=1 Tax=Curtobacterium sp. UCD-KPL2560 TaxID=1885315 RepID=UPI0008259D59|nr:hypothetical protein [Curtobacterium sp. UCD-KPL2560]
METQSGARAPLVDPFGRELEEWLRDAPATRTPYLADLVVPPVTGPVQRPAAADLAAVDGAQTAVVEPTTAADTAAAADATTSHDPSVTTPDAERTSPDAARTAPDGASEAAAPSAFRRRDRARHVAACAPAFPEPPERIALRIEDLAVEVAASSGRTTIERIVLLEDEVRRRDEDLARLAAWEATVAGYDDAEVTAAREFAHAVFADLLADAAAESDRRDRAAARRATASRSLADTGRGTADRGARTVGRAAARRAAMASPVVPTVAPGAEATAPGRDEPARLVLSLPAVSPVSANTRPTPLVQPATGPTVIDRAAFAAVLTAHTGATASTPVVLPETVASGLGPDGADATRSADTSSAPVTVDQDQPGWWARLVARLLRLVGRR